LQHNRKQALSVLYKPGETVLKNNARAKAISFLANLPLFNELDATELGKIAEATTELHLPRGELIVQRGDPCVGFHTVVYGRVKLSFTSPHGTEKVVEIIEPGNSFGLALMFMEKPYIVSAHTLADAMLLHVSKEAVFDGLERDPKFARKMLAGMSRRLHGLICDVESYSLNSGTQRVIGYLLKEHPPRDGEQIVLKASKSVIASRLNLTPEHFSRILHDLVENKMIDVCGRGITLLDIEKLQTYEK
jgi:CRP/FNR family transcriptional regulator, dissimilatory nitrate respiration regulator